MDAGVPLSTVNSIGYYILVDLDNNGSLDRWYMNTITGSAPASEDWYLLPTINATDSGWQRYDAVGANFVAVGSPGAIEAGVTDHTVSLGLQFNLNSFTPVGSNYMAVWADNIFTGAVPEPSGLLLACFGALGILARRGRRQSA
jgi:hypothetical protein